MTQLWRCMSFVFLRYSLRLYNKEHYDVRHKLTCLTESLSKNLTGKLQGTQRIKGASWLGSELNSTVVTVTTRKGTYHAATLRYRVNQFSR